MEYDWSETEASGREQMDGTPSPSFIWTAPGASSRPSALQATGLLVPRSHKARKMGGMVAGGSLVLQAAAELPPASLPSPAARLEAEGLQLVLEGLVVHGPVVLGLTERRVLWEEFLVAAFEDIHLRVVEAGVVVGGPVSFPDETAHARPPLR